MSQNQQIRRFTEQAAARRRAEQPRLRGIDRTLDEADRRAADLNRKILPLLADQ